MLIRLLEKRRSNTNPNTNQVNIGEPPLTSRKPNLQEEKPFDKEKSNERKDVLLVNEIVQERKDSGSDKIESTYERRDDINRKKESVNDRRENHHEQRRDNLLNTSTNNIMNMNISNSPQRVTKATQDTHIEPGLCKDHHRRLEIVCIDHRCRICTNCALFGTHKNHEIKTEEEVFREVGQRAESLIDIFSLIEMNQNKLFDQQFVDNLNAKLKSKYDELAKIISEKFNV